MPLFEWTKSLSVDINFIDNQHKKLFGYINDLYDALEKKKTKEILQPLMENLEDYTKTHFSFEEEKFKEFNYPRTKEHIGEHQKFIKQLRQIKRRIESESADPEDLLSFLVEWLMNHIKKVDHQYIDCFHKHGLD